MAREKIPTWQLIAFAGPAVPMAAMGLPISVYLPQFYAEQMGLGLAAVGTIFLIARLWDVVTDPMMGVISDRFPSKWGRRRHWIAMSVPIVVLSAIFLFMPSAPSSSLYLFGWMFILYIGYTMLSLNHMAWGAELHEDYDQRSRIMGFREGFVILGVPIVLLVPVLIEYIGTDNVAADRVAAMGWFILLLLPITVALAVWKVPEHKSLSQSQELPLKEMVRPLLTNHPLQRVICADFLSGFSGAALGSMFLFEAKYVWQVDNPSLLLLFYFFAGLGFVPIVVKLSYRLGKHQTLAISVLITSIGTLLFFVVPQYSFWITFVIYLLVGVQAGAKDFLMRSIMADVIDQDRVATGTDRSALYYSMLTLTAKVGLAASVGIIYPMLDWVGFDPTVANDEATLSAVRVLAATSPTLLLFLVFAIMWRFPLDKSSQQKLRAQLNQ